MRFRVVTLLAIVSSLLSAQTTGTATLVGTITDSSGAVMPGAQVKVLNTATSFLSETVTNSEGSYYVPYLSPGTYRVTIEAAGFKMHVRDGLLLRTNESPRIDVQLEVGSIADSVKVNASAPLLETETSATGQIMEGETV